MDSNGSESMFWTEWDTGSESVSDMRIINRFLKFEDAFEEARKRGLDIPTQDSELLRLQGQHAGHRSRVSILLQAPEQTHPWADVAARSGLIRTGENPRNLPLST
jgi:hypothetical protein